MVFKLVSPYKPAGGQPQAIKQLIDNFSKCKKQTLLGITGSGKTFMMANVIANLNKKTLVIAHNKTLAAQLYRELSEFFPENAVEYFVSFYDYYQPESYLPQTDTYIEKDSSKNATIDAMRLRATASIMSRDDVIVVASVSCIYGLGNPKNWQDMSITLKKKSVKNRTEIIQELVNIQYERNDTTLQPNTFRVKGDTIDVMPGYEEYFIRIELFGNEIDRITKKHKITGDTIQEVEKYVIFPAKHFVTPEEEQEKAINSIEEELKQHLPKLDSLAAARLKQRTKYDLEMIKNLGYCNGIENYSRHFDGRKPGEPPYTLLDFFGDDYLLIIDESHQTIPQIRAMSKGDKSRKESLVTYGFRLPSAYDNRPLTFEEFEKKMPQTLFVSATPGDYELKVSEHTVEQIIRPTGLLDPEITVKPVKGQIDDLISEIQDTISRNNKVLITTLTKKMAEDLTNYLATHSIRCRYLHSEIDTLERTELIRQLRADDYDVLVGINLLREGIDIPEVELVAILDADKEGFLRNTKSLLQTIGRAARNANGRVIMYADKITDSMQEAIITTHERRKKQIDWNNKHNIIPQTIKKPVPEAKIRIKDIKHIPKTDLEKAISSLEEEMQLAAERLEFELAIELRDQLRKLQKRLSET